ncbi:MAG: UDP-2,3-diacylglucosamine diphosphatase [Muribaculaceae bacterium]|nr:UDP-2,3-diacylglucosamine diphosphatase [Muribaculaceae bacterium]
MSSRRRYTYFLSDIHLGAAYTDVRTREAKVVRFLRSVEENAKAVYLLGDVLDYWFEYRTVVPRGYVRFFGQLARMADAGIHIVWFIGNHDIWLFDYLRDEIGIEVVDTPAGGVFRQIDGATFFLGHGDTYGPQHADYRVLRALFHNKLCQKLFSAIHPRWTVPLAHAWSSHNRTSRGNPEQGKAWKEHVLQNLAKTSEELAAAHPELQFIVIGHYHMLVDHDVSDTCRLIVLGEWLTMDTYAVFDGSRMSLHRWSDNKLWQP